MSEVTLERQLLDIMRDPKMPEYVRLAKVEMLINLVVDVNEKGYLSTVETPLYYALIYGQKEVADMLIKNGGEVDESYYRDESMVFIAENNYVDLAEFLIKKGVGVNYKDWQDNTPLILASESRYRDLVELFIKNGANIEDKNKAGENALMKASKNGCDNVAKYLIEKGANVNEVDKSGASILMEWVKREDVDIVKMLLEKGANVNYKTDHNVTALMSAVSLENKEMVELLINAGADVNIKDSKGKTALARCRNNDMQKVIIDAVKMKKEKTGKNRLFNLFQR